MAEELDEWIGPPSITPKEQVPDEWIGPQGAAAEKTAEQPRYQFWPERLARGLYSAAKSAFTLPGDVYAGRVDPTSEEGIGRAAEMAMLTTPGGRAAVTRGTAPEVREAIEGAARQGVDVPRFMAGETTVMPRIAESLRATPLAGESVERAAEQLRGGLGQAMERLAPETSPQVAGEIAKEGIRQTIKTKPGVREAYEEGVESLITNPNARVQIGNTLDEISRIMSERAASNIPGQSAAVKLFENAMADPRGMTYEGIKGLRTFLGEQTPQELVAAGIRGSEQKRLYGALTKDLREAARAGGGEEAVTAWEAANALARQTAQERTELYKIVGAKGDASPEAVFSRLAAMAGSTSTANISRLQMAKKSMDPEAWGQVSAGILSKMGRDLQGNFSPDRFVTAYSKLTPQARSTLFNPEQQRSLTDIYNVSRLVNQKATRFANVSRTAHTAIGFHTLMQTFLNPLNLLKEMSGGVAVSWWLTRPAVVRAASNAGRASLSGSQVLRERALGALKATMASEIELKKEGKSMFDSGYARGGAAGKRMNGGRVTKAFRARRADGGGIGGGGMMMISPEAVEQRRIG